MKDELEASEKDPAKICILLMFIHLYIWMKSGLQRVNFLNQQNGKYLRENVGIETPIETIDVLAKEKAELDEWREEKGFF